MSESFFEYGVAFIVFFLTHSLPAMPGLRQRLIGALGQATYLAIYSVISIAAVAWVISAGLRAPLVPLWTQEAWMRDLPFALMPIASMLLVAGLAAPNPFSVTLNAGSFDPAKPGMVSVTRHPVLMAFALWAGVHLLANGDLAMVILFGVFAAFALAGIPHLERRARHRLGDATYRELAKGTSVIPFVALVTGRTRLAGLLAHWPWILAGIALWLVLLTLHEPIVGVSPMP